MLATTSRDITWPASRPASSIAETNPRAIAPLVNVDDVHGALSQPFDDDRVGHRSLRAVDGDHVDGAAHLTQRVGQDLAGVLGTGNEHLPPRPGAHLAKRLDEALGAEVLGDQLGRQSVLGKLLRRGRAHRRVVGAQDVVTRAARDLESPQEPVDAVGGRQHDPVVRREVADRRVDRRPVRGVHGLQDREREHLGPQRGERVGKSVRLRQRARHDDGAPAEGRSGGCSGAVGSVGRHAGS